MASQISVPQRGTESGPPKSDSLKSKLLRHLGAFLLKTVSPAPLLWISKEGKSRSVVSDSLWPHALPSPWHFPGRNTGVGGLSLLQGIFPTQGSNPGLPHCRQILYQLKPQGSPPSNLKKIPMGGPHPRPKDPNPWGWLSGHVFLKSREGVIWSRG